MSFWESLLTVDLVYTRAHARVGHRQRLLGAVCTWMVVTALSVCSLGQNNPAAKSQKSDELQIPARQSMTLTTQDGVSLFVEYYPGGFYKMGDTVRAMPPERVVPLILIHGWGGRGADFSEFAGILQQYGYAVAVPDLRGHGRSVVVRTASGVVNLDPQRMNPRELNAVLTGMTEDIETVKAFLLKENNNKKLNIERLGVVGVDVGALVAMNWAVMDWNKRDLPAFKQGKDVKLLVLISPPESFRTLNNRAFLNHPVTSSSLYTMIVVGSADRKSQQDADKLYRFLEKRHKEPEKTLKFVALDTSLQGAQLLRRDMPVFVEVGRFLYANLLENPLLGGWTDRSIPVGQ